VTDLPLVHFQTIHGDIVVELDIVRAPRTAGHFLKLVESGALAEAIFYRVVRRNPPGEGPPTIDIIQGGLGFDRAGEPPSVPHEGTDETGLNHVDGAISLARGHDHDPRGDFFICIGDLPILDAGGASGQDGGYPVFGRVIEGMDVVRAIQQLKSDAPAPEGGDARLAGQFLDEPVAISFA